MSERYIRQEAFYGVGKEGQEKLRESRVAVVGMGALGSASANSLARSGVGYLRLIDRDFADLTNLQRQMLYTEQDAAEERPKAEAAAEHLREFNSEIAIEGAVEDVNSRTVDGLISDVDLVIDATDNRETRLLLNEACRHKKLPWIYGAALGSSGMTMNILWGGEDPCFCCMTRQPTASATHLTCVSAGILNTVTAIVSSLQCTEALKILTGSDRIRKELIRFDLWQNTFHTVRIEKDPECPVCGQGIDHYYGKDPGMKMHKLCGRDTVQILPEEQQRADFGSLEKKLRKAGNVLVTTGFLMFDNGKFNIRVFRDGRVWISGVTTEEQAKSVFAEYIG